MISIQDSSNLQNENRSSARLKCGKASVFFCWSCDRATPAGSFLALGTRLTSSMVTKYFVCYFEGSDRTNVCWVKEGCSSLKPAACSSLPLEVVDQADDFSPDELNLHLNTGCYSGNVANLQNQLNNAPASCNPPCFRITKPGEYCYMSTRNNNFSNRRHMGQITVT